VLPDRECAKRAIVGQMGAEELAQQPLVGSGLGFAE
jgi:hypothetical protein